MKNTKRFILALLCVSVLLTTASCNKKQNGFIDVASENISNAEDVSSVNSDNIAENSEASSAESISSAISDTASLKSNESISEKILNTQSSTSSVTDESNIKITDISQSYCRTMFLDSGGNVYLSGRDIHDETIEYSTPVKIFTNAKAISSEKEDVFNMLSIVDINNDYYAVGFAPDGSEYSEFTKFMSDVKKAGKGLILKQDNSLYIWGSFKDIYSDGSIPELDLNAKTPQLLMNNVKEFYGNYMHGYALTLNGDLYTWGVKAHGYDNYGFAPIVIASGVREAGVYAGSEWFITNESILYTIPFSNITYHNDWPEKHTFPTPVMVAENVKSAWLNNNSPAYINGNDTLYMWSSCLSSDGVPSGDTQKIAENVKQASSSYGNVYLDTTGNLITFGGNQSGMLGIGKENNYFSSEKNTVLTDITKFYYANNIFAINNNGEVYMWGDNMSFCGGIGKTGDDFYDINTPHKVVFN